jgi:glycosyltransferase involved in cell wall biosynthesis
MVSVIIPTYNRAWSIGRAIDSVLAQTVRDFELIVVDDGSTDGTGRYLGTTYPDLRVITIPHSGVSGARNTGIRNAQGKWIAFLDSDDYWMPEKLSEQLSYLALNRRYRICHTDEIWIRNGRRINQGKKHQKTAGWFFAPSLRLCLISPSSVMIERSVFDEVGWFDEEFEYVEDYELWLRITARHPVGYIDRKLVVKTGGHEDQLSRRIEGIERYRIAALEKLLKTVPLSDELLEQAEDMYLRKCQIYRSGCSKRGRTGEAARISAHMDELLKRKDIKGVRNFHAKDPGN